MNILLLDIETAPSEGYIWKLFDENIPLDRLIEPGYILCWSAKWLGKKEVFFDSINQSSRKKMLKGIYDLLDEADAVVHYNGKRFDIPNLNREFLLHGFLPPAPYKQIDLITTARQQFKFVSNKLTHIVDYLGIGKKVKHAPFSMWIGCMKGDEKAWKEMETYNKNDTVLLESLYDTFLPWIKNHPNMGLYVKDENPVCIHCASPALVTHGTVPTSLGIYTQYRCKGCGKRQRGSKNLLTKDKRESIMRNL